MTEVALKAPLAICRTFPSCGGGEGGGSTTVSAVIAVPFNVLVSATGSGTVFDRAEGRRYVAPACRRCPDVHTTCSDFGMKGACLKCNDPCVEDGEGEGEEGGGGGAKQCPPSQPLTLPR